MEESQVFVAEEQLGTAARSELYRVLSSLFYYPKNTTAETLQALVSVLHNRLPALPYEPAAADELVLLLDELTCVAGAPGLPVLEDAYTALFDNCRGRSAVSLYEKDYGNGDAKMVWEEAIRFYEHFGLNFDVKHSHDWPDHIGAELEFMHYLTFMEAAAPAADRAVYVHGQRDFLSRRLARWTARFANQVSGASENTPYGLFARLVEALIDAEMAYLGLPREQVGHWVPMPQGQSATDAQGRRIIPIIDQAAMVPSWEMEEPFV